MHLQENLKPLDSAYISWKILNSTFMSDFFKIYSVSLKLQMLQYCCCMCDHLKPSGTIASQKTGVTLSVICHWQS